ncbi:DNA (cytosine-5-)-methyltransferase [Agrobacterium sp. InxBP2]|uniref:DNA (cytosine-5-)-methyltransferase n=1 Tax=Agrobacterium sp. InxBP2 TaxID=2870329 RepID=UPI00249EFA48|nr:DNA (cytosine-5-)-methyltransferase [Agrobacterium sp. InxBP2]MCW8283564.1 DNA (cytosine-5-)-methyltransferase [Agrobacterium sp. InxBP2]
MIANHQAASLSQLDLEIAKAVPPGGNWKDIPLSIPSQRIAQIRASAAAGKGSRSTYYGRLLYDLPAFTIGTYYNRPGNGCFLHPSPLQHRTLSHREAARLQSFPDSFEFLGPQRAVCQQIGNAVPPLLAMQLAKALGVSGQMIDVFAGAGGLSLGFKWAGWETIAATDFDKNAIETFKKNVDSNAFVGDMMLDETIDRLVQSSERKSGGGILALVGGPPCQGFSTGGKRRSEGDHRNHLYRRYALLLKRIRPDIFIFENVTGLLSMSKGTFLATILSEFSDLGYKTSVLKINAADYGVPQRRNRVIIVGTPEGTNLDLSLQPSQGLRTTVRDAISDLPVLCAGEDGASKSYLSGPKSAYQKLMRGIYSPTDYLGKTTNQDETYAA